MVQNNKYFNIVLILSVLSMAACSSSKKEDGAVDPVAEEIPATTEASTDAVPSEGTDDLPAVPAETPPETAEAPVDGAVPATDPAAVTAEAPIDPATQAAADPAAVPAAEGEANATTVAAATTETTETPAETAVNRAPAGGSGEWQNYKVQHGDTLMKIAFETYGDLYRWREIFDANRDRITSPTAIPAGTVIKVERPSSAVAISRNGEKYLIKHGDTLGTISSDVYGTTAKWRKLWENNRELIKDPNRIFAGFHLYYTVDEEFAPKPLAQGTKDMNRMPASAPAAVQQPSAPVSDSTAPAAVAPGASTTGLGG